MTSRCVLAIAFCGLAVAAIEPASAADNDYPTAARADYVFGCMAANGNTREALSEMLLRDRHDRRADALFALRAGGDALSLQAGGGVGGRVGLFRDPPQIKAVIEELRRAQAEANLQCR